MNARTNDAAADMRTRDGMSCITVNNITLIAASSEPMANNPVNTLSLDDISKHTGSRGQHCTPDEAFFLQQ